MKLPTLIMVGEHDKLTPPAISEMMQSKLPSSELHMVPGAGHLSNLENPDEFNRHLLRFLENA
jgi:pimeloyl-ACP methyl ester carboxylesterase